MTRPHVSPLGRFLATIVATAFAVGHLDAAGRIVSFRGQDGRMWSGFLMEAGARPAPAVVLVPMLGGSRDDWQVVSQRLAEANITALAVDLPSASLPADATELTRWHQPIAAATEYLGTRAADVLPGSIGVAGASLGANLSMVAAVGDPRIRSVALISPSLDYRGVRIEALMGKYGTRPALLIASLLDPYAARSVRTLAQNAAGTREVRWSEASGHGTVLLSRDGDLVRVLVEWFQATLPVQ